MSKQLKSTKSHSGAYEIYIYTHPEMLGFGREDYLHSAAAHSVYTSGVKEWKSMLDVLFTDLMKCRFTSDRTR